ncbi:MAG: 4Fe-4S binding protein [Kiritimatiellaeota bacterium]|nr:4Fe-4S binding protein [Kiritimatiellota bacterium]
MKRKIITIDEEKCNGCGDCVSACAEGAIQIVNGKARLVKKQFCDGFGDCLGECPTGALKIEEREVPGFDPAAARRHVAQTGGTAAVKKFDDAAARHGLAPAEVVAGVGDPGKPASTRPATVAPPAHHHGGDGCPGTRMRVMPPGTPAALPTPTASGLPAKVNPSELAQWPIQIHLVSPQAPYFKNKELVVMSTCGPLASADVHWRFLRGRAVVVGCPKLDDTSGYAEKLAQILAEPTIPRVLVVRMEVPCCGGLTAIVQEAATLSGRPDLQVEEVTLGVGGEVIAQEEVTP